MVKADFETILKHHVDEYNLVESELRKAVRAELTALVAKEIADQIKAGTVRADRVTWGRSAGGA